MESILVVCQGNICRSPMAEGLFRQELQQNHSRIRVTSAGLTGLTNQPAALEAQAVMLAHGIDISSHRSRHLTLQAMQRADLILVMTKAHQSLMKRQFLTVMGKIFLLGHWSNFEIQDPVMQPYAVYEAVHQKIRLAWEDWKIRLLSCPVCV